MVGSKTRSSYQLLNFKFRALGKFKFLSACFANYIINYASKKLRDKVIAHMRSNLEKQQITHSEAMKKEQQENCTNEFTTLVRRDQLDRALTSNLPLRLAFFRKQKTFSSEYVQQQHSTRQSVAHWLELILISVPIIFSATKSGFLIKFLNK